MGWNDESDGQQYVEFPDDVVTPEKWKELTERQVLPEGQYKFKIAKHERVVPTDEKVGGDRVTFTVLIAPPNARMPEGGWPPSSRLFKVYANPSDKQKASEGIDRRDRALLLKAVGIDLSQGGNAYLALQQAVGSEVLAVVKNRDVDGEVYSDIKAFKPA